MGNNFYCDYFLTGGRKLVKFDTKTAHFRVMFQAIFIAGNIRLKRVKTKTNQIASIFFKNRLLTTMIVWSTLSHAHSPIQNLGILSNTTRNIKLTPLSYDNVKQLLGHNQATEQAKDQSYYCCSSSPFICWDCCEVYRSVIPSSDKTRPRRQKVYFLSKSACFSPQAQ